MNNSDQPRSGISRWRRLAGVAALAAGVLVLLLAAMPWQLLRGQVVRLLSDRLGAPVTIAAASRRDWFSFHPLLQLDGVRLAQPGWAGAGDLLRARRIAVRFAAFPILLGRMRIEGVTIEGADLALVRDRQGRWNLPAGGGGDDSDSSRTTGIDTVTVRDSRLSVRDMKRQMSFAGPLSADTRTIRYDARGTHRGRPLSLALRADAARPGRPWPLRVTLASPLAALTATGRTERPLALDRLEADVTARATDAQVLDDVIEAGLPGTQAVTLAAHIRRDKPAWHVERLTGRVGRSPFTGRLDVDKRDGRTKLAGRLDFASLDFDDLASNAQRARAAAGERQTGPRVFPETPIHFEKLSNTDGDLTVHIRRLRSDRPLVFRTIDARLVMDRRRLTIAPLRIGLIHGALSGRASVDHRRGQPRLAIDLKLADARLQDLLRDDAVAMSLHGHILLAGTGRTVRAAFATADGRVGLAGRGGTMDRKLATFASGDVLKSIGAAIGGGAGRVPARCVIARFSARGGRLTAGTLLLDAANARADGTGSIRLADERIALAFTGRAKRPGAIQTDAPLRLVGTLSRPQVEVLPQSIRRQGLFKKVGALLESLSTGNDRPVAAAADCAGLAAAALR